MKLFAQDYLILGCGYVGSFFLKKYPQSQFTKRTIQEHGAHCVEFDLFNKATWERIKETKNILWTFPVVNHISEQEIVYEFFERYCKNKNVIILSSTSAYLTDVENELVDETFPIQNESPRYLVEEQLRKAGGLILHLSGIIGPNRYPKNWYLQNRVKNGKNVLNYIHVEDIVFFIQQLFLHYAPSERFNLTSADYKTHQEIANKLHLNPNFNEYLKSNGSKKVSNKKLLQYLLCENYNFRKYPEDCECDI